MSRRLGVLVVLLAVSAGCLGSISNVAEMDFTVEPNSSNPDMAGGPDGFPRVETTDSRVIVTDQIQAIGDPDCREVMANATVNDNRVLVLTVQSGSSSRTGTCNMTATTVSYQATVTVDGRQPQSVRVRHVRNNETTDEWTILIEGGPLGTRNMGSPDPWG